MTKIGNHLIFDFDTWTYDIAFAAEKENQPFSWCEEVVAIRFAEINARLAGTSHSGYLTGKGNFRHKVATLRPYKGNRTAEKPVHYQAIRNLLIKQYGAVVVNGMEADDAIAIEATQNPDAIVVSNDKDMYQLLCGLYRYRGDTFHPKGTPPTHSMYNLCHQVLTGDSTDNYPGIPGVGEKKAFKILPDANYGVTIKQLLDATMFAFIEFYGEEGIERFLEQMRLAFLVRELDEQGNPVLPTAELSFYERYYS